MSKVRPGTAKQTGLSRSALYLPARAGWLERIARGIYLPADAPADWNLIEASQRPRKA